LPESPHFAQYSGKFCFDYAPWTTTEGPGGREEVDKPIVGVLNISLRGRVEQGRLDEQPCWGDCETLGRIYLMSFDDESSHWQRVRSRWSKLSCAELRSDASGAIDLTPGLTTAATDFTTSIRIVEHIRPRFWYFAFVNCGARVVVPVSFKLHATNVRQGPAAEFGIDERECLIVEGLFCGLFVALGVATYLAVGSPNDGPGAERRRLLLRVLQVSTFCSGLGCAGEVLHRAVYASNGTGVALAGVFGTLCDCTARALLMALQMLVARGWALLSAPSEWQHRHTIAAALVVVVLLTVGCEVHAEYFRDQSTSLYRYQSWPGGLILALQLGLLLLAWSWVWAAYRRETVPAVRVVHRAVLAVCGIYFATLPVVCLLADVVRPWWRRKIVEGVELGSRSVATGLLLMCLHPWSLQQLMTAQSKSCCQSLEEAELQRAEASEGEALAPAGCDGAHVE